MGQQGVGLTSPSWGHACSLPRHALPSLGLSVVSKGMGRLLFPSNCVTGAHGMLAHVYVCLLQASASHSVGGPARSSCPSALLSCRSSRSTHAWAAAAGSRGEQAQQQRSGGMSSVGACKPAAGVAEGAWQRQWAGFQQSAWAPAVVRDFWALSGCSCSLPRIDTPSADSVGCAACSRCLLASAARRGRLSWWYFLELALEPGAPRCLCKRFFVGALLMCCMPNRLCVTQAPAAAVAGVALGACAAASAIVV
jgi:hypothetical protein